MLNAGAPKNHWDNLLIRQVELISTLVKKGRVSAPQMEEGKVGIFTETLSRFKVSLSAAVCLVKTLQGYVGVCSASSHKNGEFELRFQNEP